MKHLILIASLVLLFGCKEDRVRYKGSGIYNVELIELTYSSLGVVDSSKQISNAGTWIMQDNAEWWHNPFIFDSDFNVPSVEHVSFSTGKSASGGLLHWYIEDGHKERLTVWGTAGGSGFEYSSTYTILKFGKNKMILQYVSVDPGNFQEVGYKEVITLKSK